MNIRLAAIGAMVATAGMAWRPAVADDAPGQIESCVSHSVIRFGATDQRVALDADDQQRVQQEMVRRYPVLAQHGFPVSRIILWQKTGGETLFVALLEHPTKPHESCFTATFAAARFDDIRALRRKYLRHEQAT